MQQRKIANCNSPIFAFLAILLLPFKMLRDYYPRYLLTMDLVPRVSHDGIQQIYALDWLLE